VYKKQVNNEILDTVKAYLKKHFDV